MILAGVQREMEERIVAGRSDTKTSARRDTPKPEGQSQTNGGTGGTTSGTWTTGVSRS